jgi:hypothetical protein
MWNAIKIAGMVALVFVVGLLSPLNGLLLADVLTDDDTSDE